MKNSTRKYTSHIPCPCGKSSDAFSLNERGGGQCFSCGKKYSPYELGNKEEKNMLKKEDIVEEFFEFKPHRGITVDTFKRFGVSTRIVKTRDRPDGFDYEVGFPYPNGAIKIRNMEKKSFHTSGPIRDAGCFGIDKFDPNAYGTIMIVEGEFDALAASQMLDPMCAVVSVQSSSSARRDCTKDWHKINQFDKIIFALDSDEPGQKATTEIASLFDFNKTFKMDMTKYKDPNDYLINGDYVDFVRLFKQVKRFTPDNVISAFDDIAKSLEESDEDQIGTYPFTGLQEMLYGLHKGEVVVFKGEPGIGKQLCNTTPIPTPSGWTTMGELKVGDTIYGADGIPTEVTFVTEDQYVDCYEVRFSDKTSVIAGGPHKWGVYDKKRRYSVKTTTEILSDLGNRRYGVPVMKCAEMAEVDLPIDPYSLGYWLGDGHSYSANISIGFEEIDNIPADFRDTFTSISKDRTCYSVRSSNVTHKLLADNDLVKNKHIPKNYLRSSENQRRELLRGLMDSDGGVHQNSCVFYTSSTQLRDDFLELARSLGYVCSYREKQSKLYGASKKISYSVTFMAEDGYEVFKMSRKADKVFCKDKTRKLHKKYITDIVKVETVPSRCITVANKDHLYVCGKGWTVTHNTEIFRAIEHHLLKTEENCRLGLIHLEEDEGTTVRAIATYEDNYPHVHPQHKTSVDDVMKAYKSAVKGQDNKIFIYESFDMEDENKLIDTIRFLVSACGCNFIFLDHITWIGTGLEGEDERKKLDRVSQRLKLLAKELRFCLCMISHTNDDGKTRGSRNIANVANTIINLKRDKEHANEHTRRTTFFSIEKARAGGNTGPAGYAIFDKEVMQLKDVERDAEFVY